MEYCYSEFQPTEIAKEIIQQKLNFKPEIALLNIMPEIIDKKIKYCLMYIFTAARLLWAQKWKSEIPTMEELLEVVGYHRSRYTFRSTT